MSKTLDALERATHGTPSGYHAGCKSRGGCPNYESRTHLTCVRAYKAWVHYHALHSLPPDTLITRNMLRNAKGLP